MAVVTSRRWAAARIKVGKVDSGRSITFERNADWWGKDLPVSRGLYNFDHFSIEYFGDTDVARQVLRGGAYDYNREFSATGYSIGYDSPALSDGRLQKAHLAKEAPQPAQGFVFNLQNPMFQDRRVRQALAMLWDFEWSNRQMMRNLYIRQQSFFSNTDLAARQLPDAGELAILEPLRGQIPDEVFTQVFEAPKTDGSGVIRDKQLQALKLLERGRLETRRRSTGQRRRRTAELHLPRSARTAWTGCCCRTSAL